MKIVITGSAGFLGQRLANELLKNDSPLKFEQLILTDLQFSSEQKSNDPRVTYLPLDLAQPAAAQQLIDDKIDIIFHLAAIVSSHAESDFELGMKINFDTTRNLLEVARQRAPQAQFIFTSSLAVFGGDLPATINDLMAVMPQSSYGTQKAMCELLINDYSRRGFIDGRVLRLPTISVRPGKPNKAASSFASGIIREPLQGENSICPVDPSLVLWLSSPDMVVKNFIHATQIPAEQFGLSRTVNLPGISVSVQQMIDDLTAIAGKEISQRIRFEPDENINRIVSSWPGNFDTERAQSLGFIGDSHYREVINTFINNDLIWSD